MGGLINTRTWSLLLGITSGIKILVIYAEKKGVGCLKRKTERARGKDGGLDSGAHCDSKNKKGNVPLFQEKK
jgi:hypothetical protein